LRIEYEGAFYHVTARGNERKRIFFGKGDYDEFKGVKGSGIRSLSIWRRDLRQSGVIKQALGKVKEAALDQAEIAQRRELHKLRSEDVIDGLCSHFRVPAGSLGEWATALRDMAICLLKGHTFVMNRQIGEFFQGVTYSGVSKANHRFSLRMPEDRDLRKTLEKISRSMSDVKA
jgi:hypothetical protein